MTQTHTHMHTQIQCKHIHKHTSLSRQTDTHTHTHTPQNSRLWQNSRSADGCKRFPISFFLFFLFFFFYSRVSCWRQLFLLHLHRCSQPSLELLPFLCRSKAQRDGDERAPAVVGADFRAHRWMLLQWACTSEGGWWSLMWLETC